MITGKAAWWWVRGEAALWAGPSLGAGGMPHNLIAQSTSLPVPILMISLTQTPLVSQKA